MRVRALLILFSAGVLATTPDSPYTTGGIGHLGTQPSQGIMQNCDTRLILGSAVPWIDAYPPQGKARAVQIDLTADRIGLRYPAELGLIGNVKATLTAVLPLLQRKTDRAFPTERQRGMQDRRTLDRIEQTERARRRPQVVVRASSDLILPDAVIPLDCGAHTFFAARHLRLRTGQRFTGPGMLTAELTTAVQHRLPIKIVVLKNNALSEVRFEQQEPGNTPYGCDLGPIDFVAFAKACGADSFRCATPAEVRPAITAALSSPKAAIIEAIVDPDEAPAKPEEVRA